MIRKSKLVQLAEDFKNFEVGSIFTVRHFDETKVTCWLQYEEEIEIPLVKLTAASRASLKT